MLAILLCLSAALHFFRLSEPRTVIFDEVHFGTFVSAYTGSGEYFFDIHPPHGKLVIAGIAALGGYRGEQTFDAIHEPIDRVSPALLRAAPAIAGTLLPLVVFWLLLQLGASTWAAFAGGLAITLDNGLLIQTRLIALDGILLLATFAALAAYLQATGAADRLTRTAWCLAAGLLAGFAVGTKLTGLAAVAVIGLLWSSETIGRGISWGSARLAASDAIWLTSGAIAVYLAGWYIHFQLLGAPGAGYDWGSPTGAFMADTVDLHARMLSANYGLGGSHTYASAWWSWPLMVRPVSYWSSGGSHLHFLGNPIVWWGAAVGLLLALAARPLLAWTDLELPRRKSAWPQRMWVVVAGWAIALGPLTGVPRPLFMYHYLMPLIFAICGVVLWLDHVGWTRPGGLAAQRASFHAALVALLLGFALVSPFTLAYVKLPALQTFLLKLFPSWV